MIMGRLSQLFPFYFWSENTVNKHHHHHHHHHSHRHCHRNHHLKNYFQHPGKGEKKIYQGQNCVSLTICSISFRHYDYRNILLVAWDWFRPDVYSRSIDRIFETVNARRGFDEQPISLIYFVYNIMMGFRKLNFSCLSSPMILSQILRKTLTDSSSLTVEIRGHE